ncbi:hypothetical protein OG948_18910 [Embleya sp. NBC_00888]|nr:hypothetical protein OG948_18910 [Embleya sp. NBC_00888]
MQIPTETAKPIRVIMSMPAIMSDANVPARMTPAAAIEGPACSTAGAATLLGALPSFASSRDRATMRML